MPTSHIEALRTMLREEKGILLPGVPNALGARIVAILTATAKGQVTLRKDVLRHMDVHPGDKIVLDKLPGGRIEVKAAKPNGKISDPFGVLNGDTKRSLSLDEMNKVAARGWVGKR